MVLCASVKNRASKDQCPHNALRGFTLCGRHVRAKNVVLWADANQINEKVAKIGKVWRGYFVRKLLTLSGPGNLKRSLCNNADELMSMEPMTTVYPTDYFGFEENGKVYGFDIRSILDSFYKQLHPTNPYTRQVLSIETRKRVRSLYRYRLAAKLDCFYDHNKPKGVTQIIENRWLQICQIIEENGFFDIEPNIFRTMNKSQLYIFLSMVCNDLKANPAIRPNYVFWIQNVLHKYSFTDQLDRYSYYVSGILLSILYDIREQYTLCFIIMSALYRL